MTRILRPFTVHNALFATWREETLGNKDYLVVNGIPLVEGVLNGRFVPAEEFGKFVKDWNDVPVVLQHPKKNGGSARVNSPDVPVIGRFYNAALDGTRLTGEFWLDKNILPEDLIADIKANRPIEISTGYWANSVPGSGRKKDRDYGLVDLDIHPDHIALLPGEIGACSIADGCGLNRNQARLASCCNSCELSQQLRDPEIQGNHYGPGRHKTGTTQEEAHGKGHSGFEKPQWPQEWDEDAYSGMKPSQTAVIEFLGKYISDSGQYENDDIASSAVFAAADALLSSGEDIPEKWFELADYELAYIRGDITDEEYEGLMLPTDFRRNHYGPGPHKTGTTQEEAHGKGKKGKAASSSGSKWKVTGKQKSKESTYYELEGDGFRASIVYGDDLNGDPVYSISYAQVDEYGNVGKVIWDSEVFGPNQLGKAKAKAESRFDEMGEKVKAKPKRKRRKKGQAGIDYPYYDSANPVYPFQAFFENVIVLPDAASKMWEEVFASAKKQYKGDEEKAAKAAWAAVKKKYKKVGEKWVMKKHHYGPGPHKSGSPQDVHAKKVGASDFMGKGAGPGAYDEYSDNLNPTSPDEMQGAFEEAFNMAELGDPIEFEGDFTTYEESGMMTGDAGLVYRDRNGGEYRMTIKDTMSHRGSLSAKDVEEDLRGLAYGEWNRDEYVTFRSGEEAGYFTTNPSFEMSYSDGSSFLIDVHTFSRRERNRFNNSKDIPSPILEGLANLAVFVADKVSAK